MDSEQFEQEQLEQREQAAAVEAGEARGWNRFHPDSDCRRCHGFGLDARTWEDCDCRSGVERVRQLLCCVACGDGGLLESEEGLLAWCDCVHAKRLRERQPNLVEEWNSRVQKLRKLGAAPRLGIM
jgi:hypothetical protein